MKKIISSCAIILTMTGCTTGSKTRVTTNYYSVGDTRPQYVHRITEQPTIVRPVVYQPVYAYHDPTVVDLSKEIGRKIYRKIQTAYYVNP